MTRPSPEDLLAETARLAYHLHWPLDTILDLEHPDRRRFLTEVDRLAGAEWPGGAGDDGPVGPGVDRPETGPPGEAHGPVFEES